MVAFSVEMSNLRRSSYFILINVRLFRRFWFIVLHWASYILLSLGCREAPKQRKARSIRHICYISDPSLGRGRWVIRRNRI